jgi:PGM1 C-terminal domain
MPNPHRTLPAGPLAHPPLSQTLAAHSQTRAAITEANGGQVSRTGTVRFAELQRRMVTFHAASRTGRGRTMVVIPSRTVDKWHEPPAESHALEERLLCLLLMLRDPGLRIVYVTSLPLPAAIVEYYLSLLPRSVHRSARARLTLVSVDDPSTRALSEKLLRRPPVVRELRRWIPAGEPCHLVPYATTELERDLALALDVPIDGADPRHRDLGTKSGSRRLFAQAAVPHPLGVERVAGAREVIGAIEELRATKPEIGQVVVKLDEGVSGDGNAIVDLRGLPRPGERDEREHIAQRVDGIAVEAGVSAAAFLDKLTTRGGIVEERIAGPELRSPSVQLDITPAGAVRIVSTHDQLLGGHNGHSYVGCRFPAESAYAAAIIAIAAKVGRHLAGAGVIGRCAVDFVVTRDDHQRWHPYAIELNLRKGGTTHPFVTLEQLTGGAYDAETATFTTPAGACKHYVASDHLSSPLLRHLGRAGLFDVSRRRRLGFDHARERGVVFHMLSALEPLGRIGLTAIGDTAAQAERQFERARVALLQRAIDEGPR